MLRIRIRRVCFCAFRIRILLSSNKILWKTLIPTVLWLFYLYKSLKKDVNVPSKSNKQKKIESIKQIAESGSISQRHRSEDRDPDRYQNVMDPQHWEEQEWWIVLLSPLWLEALDKAVHWDVDHVRLADAARSPLPVLHPPRRRKVCALGTVESCTHWQIFHPLRGEEASKAKDSVYMFTESRAKNPKDPNSVADPGCLSRIRLFPSRITDWFKYF